MKATLTNYRQSPRKVRTVATAMKGKNVSRADVELSFMPKRAADPIKKLIASAVANAKVQGVDTTNLVVKTIEVNKGLVMKRYMPRAMGVAKPIRKKMSHVTLTLAEVAPKAVKKVAAKKAVAKKSK